MDAGLVCKRSREPLSRASEWRNDLRPIASSPPKQEKCFHFSIRGYVAEARKNDRNICWPFSDYINLEKQENLLPPISVREFRWWDCQKCLNKISDRGNGEMTSGYACNLKAKETSIDQILVMESHQPTTSNCLHVQDAISERTLLIGFSTESNSFPVTVDTSNQSHPLVPLSNGEKDSFKHGNFKEATLTCRSGSDIHGDDQVSNKNMTSDDAVIQNHQNCERYNTRKEDRSISCSNQNEGFSILPFCKRTQITMAVRNDESSPEESKNLPEGSRPIRTVAYTEKESMANSVNQFIAKDDSIVANSMSRRFRYKVRNCFRKGVSQKLEIHNLPEKKHKQVDKGKHSALNGSKNEGIHFSNQISSRKISSKKGQKTRTLEDILKSEVLDKKIPRDEYSAGQLQVKDHANLKCDAFKEQQACKVQKCINVSQKEKIKVLKRKKRQMPENEDEFPLMHWVTKMSTKTKAKLDSENKNIVSLYTKPSDSNRFEKPKSFKMKPCRSSYGDRRISGISKHYNRLTEDEYVEQTFEQPRKCSVVKYGFPKHNSKTTFTNSVKDVLGKRTMNPEHLVDGRPHKKGSTSKEQSVIQLGKERETHVVNGAKEFFGTSMNERPNDSTSYKSISMEPRYEQSNSMSYPAAVDGIPVEILKLLQENWRKRHLVNAKHSKEDEVVSAKTNVNENHEAGIPLNSMNCYQDEVISSSVENCPIRCSYSIRSAVGHEASYPTLKDQVGQSFKSGTLANYDGLRAKAVKKSCHEWNFSDINSNGKCNSRTSLHQNGQFDVFNGVVESSSTREQQRSVITLPLNSTQTCPPTEKIFIRSANSCNGGTIMRHDPHRGSSCSQSSLVNSSLLHGMSKSPEIFPHRYLMSKSSQNVLLPKNSVVSQLEKRDMSNSERCKFLGEVHGYIRSSEPSLNLYKKDSFPAMHLLELIDPAISSTDLSCSSDRRPQEFNAMSEFLRISKHSQIVSRRSPQQACTRKNQASMHLPGASYNLCFQAPRNGVPEPSLATNNTYSENCSSTLSYYRGRPQPFSQEGSLKEKQKISLLTSQRKSCSQKFLSNDGNLEGSFLSLPSYATQNKQRNEVTQLHHQKKNFEAHRSPNINRGSELCILNRNPADFTDPVECNDYMILYDSQTYRKPPLHHNKLLFLNSNHQKRHKAMKLTALKELLRN